MDRVGANGDKPLKRFKLQQTINMKTAGEEKTIWMGTAASILAMIEAKAQVEKDDKQQDKFTGEGLRPCEIQALCGNLRKRFGNQRGKGGQGSYIDYSIHKVLAKLTIQGNLKRVALGKRDVRYFCTPSGSKYLDYLECQGRFKRSVAASGYNYYS